jgi:signal transduction histidine kinase
MNLITRITLVFALTSLVIFFAGGIITYRIMKREVDFEQRRFLVERLAQVESYISRRMPEDTVKRTKLLIVPADSLSTVFEPRFSDTLVVHSTLDRYEPHLKMTTRREIGGKKYDIEIFDLIIESDDIVDGVVESLVITYIILLVSLILIGFSISYVILKPFRNTLDFIRDFSLRDYEEAPKTPDSKLPEFRKLNSFLQEMVNKTVRDYQSLKEFSENASHELKTPLAIMQGKVDMLMNDESVGEYQLEQLSSIQSTLKRLSRLSDSLVLLTKIDNYEFSRHEKVNMSEVTMQLIEDFSELAGLKSLSLTSNIQKDVYVLSDKTLIEIMISNLIINAIRHNYESGSIEVHLAQNLLNIRNTGATLVGETTDLFDRFKKSNQSDSSLGLGLAIVKKICEFSGFVVKYQQNAEQHEVTISFRPDSV